jgi:lysozyme family protein
MANFQLFIPILQRVEGGYQNLVADSGNYNSLGQRVGTNYGISARFYEGVINRPPTVADMQAITKDQAKAMYKKYFWDDVHGDLMINQSVANLITDHAVNGGESSIGKIVQKILVNDFKKVVTIDGDIGLKTVAAINSVNQQVLFDKIKKGRENAYYNLGGEFLAGWLERLKSFNFSEEKKKQLH